jgi:hypothetical protein
VFLDLESSSFGELLIAPVLVESELAGALVVLLLLALLVAEPFKVLL